VHAASATLEDVLEETVVTFDVVIVVVIVARLAGLPLGMAEAEASAQNVQEQTNVENRILIKHKAVSEDNNKLNEETYRRLGEIVKDLLYLRLTQYPERVLIAGGKWKTILARS